MKNESTFIVTRVRKIDVTPPITPAMITFTMQPPKAKRVTDYIRRIIMAGMAYYDKDAEYVVTEVMEGHIQTWYFSGDRLFAST